MFYKWLFLLFFLPHLSMGQENNSSTTYTENELWGLAVDKPITPAVYDTLISIKNSPLYIAKKHNSGNGINSTGVISNKGKIIIPLNYLQIIPSEDAYIVKQWVNREVVFGVLSKSNDVILNSRFDDIEPFGKNWITKSQGRLQLYNTQGLILKELLADSIASTTNPNYIYTFKNGKIGLINAHGTAIYPPIYKSIDFISNEWVASDLPKWQIISSKDTTTVYADSLKIWHKDTHIIGINKRYQIVENGEPKGKTYDAINITNPSFAITTSSKLYGATHRNGQEILTPAFRNLHYKNGYFYGYKNHYWGVYDTLGNRKSIFKYDSIGAIQDGLFPIKRKGKWGFMNRMGKEVIHCIYDSKANFKNGKAIISYFGAQGIINLAGNWEVRPIHTEIVDFSYNFYIHSNNGINYLTNYSGELIYFSSHQLLFKNETIYEIRTDHKKEISSLGTIINSTQANKIQSWRIIKVGDKYGFEDLNGQLKITYRYDSLMPYNDGLAAFELRSKWGFINANEQIIVQPYYSEVTPFINGFSVVALKGNKGLICKNGEYILNPKYDTIEFLKDDLWVVSKDGLWGIFNSKGNVIVQPKYSCIQYIKDDIIIISSNHRYGAVNNRGESVLPRVYNYISYDNGNNVLLLKSGN